MNWLQRTVTNQIEEQGRSGGDTKRKNDVKQEIDQLADAHFRGGKNPDTSEERQTRPDGEDEEEDVEIATDGLVRNLIHPGIL